MMLLTITYEGSNTQELGYLLHKNPYRAQEFQLSFGTAYVFYPEVTDERTTAALLLEINPIDLAKGKPGSKDGGLFDYLNDHPYICSSFMSTAVNRVFGTAMSGRCDKHQQLAETPLKLTACVHMLPCRSDELPREFFDPLGYTVGIERSLLNDRFPEWGSSPLIDLTVSGTVRLSELLNHLYILIPAFGRKHYYVDCTEIEKLAAHGKGWLADHPARDKIIYRCFMMKKDYARTLIDRLTEHSDEGSPESGSEVRRVSLSSQRYDAVKNAVLESGAASVIDLGCGECRLTEKLLSERQIQRVGAADVSTAQLERAKKRLSRSNEHQLSKLTLMHASLTYTDKRFSGYDCAVAAEVIEHIDPSRLTAFGRVLFGRAAPRTVIITTPNREYNANYEFIPDGEFRHSDHRFEWDRAEFRSWAEGICMEYGYRVSFHEIGETDESYGAPTQMGVFTKCVSE